ncbi:hypothetical protein CYLTODRAFT_421977 [Cylindrobasidium torrendii FP15055 ss-10]|uniref:Uncharacterized protein n=1 Tax=Cylindrobasidium torrendii FP15055 ss-10 TaxID=1314674 RepID=A0A0D7BBX9_9AGAR|nr:hypothetical protein CYLTODRAFT_421977 [Cylindrobasidium torrendii FP15055 ss-10]
MPHTDAVSKSTRPQFANALTRLLDNIANKRIVELYHQIIEDLSKGTCSARRFSHVYDSAEACATCSNAKSCTTQPGRIACGPCLATQRVCSRVEAAARDVLDREYEYEPRRVSRALRRNQLTVKSSSSLLLPISPYKTIAINRLDFESRADRLHIERKSTPPPRGSIVPRSPHPSLPAATTMPSQLTISGSTVVGRPSRSISPPDTPGPPQFPRLSGVVGPPSTPAEQLAEDNKSLQESLAQRDHIVRELRTERNGLYETVKALRAQLQAQEAVQGDKARQDYLEREILMLRAERNERDVLAAKNEELERKLEANQTHLYVYARLLTVEHLRGEPSRNELLEGAAEISQCIRQNMCERPTVDDFKSLQEIVATMIAKSNEADGENWKKERQILKTAIQDLDSQVCEWLAKVNPKHF